MLLVGCGRGRLGVLRGLFLQRLEEHWGGGKRNGPEAMIYELVFVGCVLRVDGSLVWLFRVLLMKGCLWFPRVQAF